MPELGSTERDLRIDFFRGLALYMIIFDHIPGDPLSRLTYTRLGVSDAAEIFVFLSGLSCGIVYARVLQRRGVAGLLRSVYRRSLQIYIYYLIASVTTILLIALSSHVVAIPANHQAFIELHQGALAAIRSSVFLVSPPDLPGILVLYLELTAFVIPVFLLIAARNAGAALALSGSIWLLAQIDPDVLPRLADHSYFNPLAWQFLFCIGMFIARSYNGEPVAFAGVRTPKWILVAWSVVAIGLAYRIAVALGAGALRISDPTLVAMKENLSPIRLAHFMSVALLVASYVTPKSAILSWPGANALIQSGRRSLQVFCLGAVLSVILNLFIAVDGPLPVERIVLDGLAILLIAFVVAALARPRLDRPAAAGAQPLRGRDSALR